ncbi:MAG TPA: HD domain-containing phosphohydrolase [Gallionellaceae bacterium]
MNREQQILTILYEMALVIGGEVSVSPLLTKTLQRLLYFTSFPAGLVFLDVPKAGNAATLDVRLDAAVGDFELGKNIGKTLAVPAALLLGDAHLREDASLLKPLSNPNKPYTAFLRLPINGQGVILLLAPATPHTDLPLTRIFKPVMEILAKAIMLCRDHEAYTSGLISQRDVAWEGLRKVNRALRALTAGNEAMARVQTEEALLSEMCRTLTGIGGYRMAWVCYAVHDEQHSVRIMAQSGFDDGYLESVRFSWADTELGQGPTGTALRTGEPQIVRDVKSEARFAPWRDGAVRRGYFSVLALPLKNSEGEVFGAVTIDASEANAFDEEEILLMGDLVRDIAYGIGALRDREERRRSAEELHQGLEDAIQAIASTVEMRDPYTAGHQRRVGQLAAAIASEMGLAPERIHGLRLAASVHDVGKIGVPAEILSKPGHLPEIEFGLIKLHPKTGYEILKDVKFPWPIAQMVLQHHERMDGSGYPQGLKGEQILLEARILTVADVVEAIFAFRPYRPALGIDQALAEISDNRDRIYDPQVVDACLRVIKERGFVFDQTG